MKKILLFLILATAASTVAAEQPDDYCSDQASWQQWQQLLEDNAVDDGVAALYAFRVGLCSMVRSGKIDTERAIKLFEGMRDAGCGNQRQGGRRGSRHQEDTTHGASWFIPGRNYSFMIRK